ncbi:helix-turn-helix domain-containing protein, partial [Halovivax sp.]|uniref:helix-turn-helix domain-containing protein n=1 Tax=Halovivax sp. TaxID=1935978 RepID=UPI0025BE17EF
YYEQPRKASVSELAGRTSVARSTYEEHLRKAENKVLTNVGRFVRATLGTRTDGPLGVSSPDASRSAELD